MEKITSEKYVFGILRIALGFVFFWAFIDKMFGLGFATTADKAVIAGGKATYGFLAFGTEGGTFAWLFQPMAGKFLVEFLFLTALLGIGVALILGVSTRLAGYSGALLMVLMWMALLPLTNNPIIDDHIIYAILLIYFANSNVGKYIGFGTKWKDFEIVKKYPILT